MPRTIVIPDPDEAKDAFHLAVTYGADGKISVSLTYAANNGAQNASFSDEGLPNDAKAHARSLLRAVLPTFKNTLDFK